MVTRTLIAIGREARLAALVVFAGALGSAPGYAQLPSAEHDFGGISDFGGVGLLQMPTARFLPDGGWAFSSSWTKPYVRTSVTMQPLPWLEGVLRYTTIQNVLYGSQEFSGDQSFKDKGFDVKIRLLEESSHWPQVVVGLRDLSGTGLFASEYLAFSRRYYDFDFTLGMGWGYAGTRGHLPNPLGLISSRFKVRQNNVGEGGTFSTGSYFRGDRVALFGGVSYQTPLPGLTLKLELDGNNYQSEPFSNNQKAASPLNLGASYRFNEWLDLSLGLERGDTLMAHFALRGDLHKGYQIPKLDSLPTRLRPRDMAADFRATADSRDDSQNQALALRLEKSLEAQKFAVDSLDVQGRRVTAVLSQNMFEAKPKAIGRAMRILANELPDDVEELSYVNLERGLETQRVTILRRDLERAVAYEGSPEEMAAHAVIEGPNISSENTRKPSPDRYPNFSWGWNPGLRQQFGGPDSSYIYQLFLRLGGEAQFSRSLSLTGDLGFNLVDNLDKLKNESDSVLPKVRSDIKEYLKQGKSGISRLQLNYLTNVGNSTYARLSGGYFEQMFGGVGGEILYKPFESRWALGLELNRVRQRDFDQLFGFRNYEVTTGHVDFYYRLPFYNVTSQISVGQYLAGDRGATLTFSRQFDSGATLGVFATKTNVSAADFGEGSFDKGFFISMPMDMISLYSSRDSFGLSWRPLSRDGGQRLSIGKRLYPIVADSNPDKTLADWPRILD